LHSLHQKYGTQVRIAPNFVSVNSVAGLHDIYGHGKKIRKAEFYSAFPAIKGVWNTHKTIDKGIHGRKRRVLSQAFSDTALKGMESVMLLYIRQLCSILARQGKEGKNEKWNMADWFSYLSYDVIGELCFGKSYKLRYAHQRRPSRRNRARRPSCLPSLRRKSFLTYPGNRSRLLNALCSVASGFP
jgi:cytochrome P450